MVELKYVQSMEDYVAASNLFKEYAAWLDIDLSFQKFEEELSELSNMYGPPKGCIILAEEMEAYVGCIAVRNIGLNIAEIKRMYVKPISQQSGTGTMLLNEAIAFAIKTEYEKIQLDTLNTMLPAINLYKKHGFYEIPAYYFNPESTAVFFEKKLKNDI